jgi:hypothetical protein
MTTTVQETTLSTFDADIAVQRHDALRVARRVKDQRAQLAGEIRQAHPAEGRHILADAIDEMPDWLETIDVWNLINWAKVGVGFQPFRDWMLARVGVKTMRRLRELSPRQRAMLAELLRGVDADRKTAA